MQSFNALKAPFRIFGVPRFDECGLLERLPLSVREAVPSLSFFGRRVPGARLGFRTNSPRFTVTVRFESIGCDVGMALFACQSAAVYASGRFLGLAFAPNYDTPVAEHTFEKSSEMEDILIYLPRNEVITEISIALEEGADVEPPTPYAHPVPVVFYGSSITEGGHCSKMSNVYNALLSRWLRCDYVNLGFSGSARGELPVADYINTLEMSALVIGYDHNAPTVEHLAATHEPFFRRIREKHPTLPILLMSRPGDCLSPEETAARRDIVRATYEHALADGDKYVRFIDGRTFYGNTDRDACSGDNTHPNDLGMYRIAQTIRPVLAEMLGIEDPAQV